MFGDLHSHSRYSDGSLKAEMLPRLAARAGLSWLSISDHDSMHSVRFAYQNPIVDGVRLIPATELTAYDFERKRRVHILCYWPDETCEALQVHCDKMAQRRNTVCTRSGKELEALYPQFKLEDAIAMADGGVLFKSTLMQVLFRYGLADGIYKETYKQLFAPGQGRVLHDPQYQTVDEVLNTIKAAHGVAVFAHPSVYKSMDLVCELVEAGRLDGVEIEHPRNTEEDKKRLYQLAKEHSLLVTGGTDFHGMNAGTPRPLGQCQTTPEQIERLNTLATQRKQNELK